MCSAAKDRADTSPCCYCQWWDCRNAELLGAERPPAYAGFLAYLKQQVCAETCQLLLQVAVMLRQFTFRR
jgi:hypothetical protein